MKVDVEQILHMVGGVGETSYATNSRIQEMAISMAKPMVEESISEVYCTLHPKSLAVADLGCSSGPTTFMVIDNITKTISNISRKLTHQLPEILFFLVDLPGNDFNTIFKSLTQYGKKLREDEGNKVSPHYVAGVPGSFYGRLFPRESIHFVHSSYSLHWLSQVPKGLAKNGGINSINKGNIYITKTSPREVFEAYLEQFQQDFSTFLMLRAEEVISGGQMVLTFLGRKNEDPLRGELTYLLDLVTKALNSIVSEGHVDKSKVDEFDIPFYAPGMEEVREVVVKEGSFDLHGAEVFELNWDPYDNCNGEYVPNSKQSGQNAARCVRAALEPMLASHFGQENIDTVFSRYAEYVANHLLHQKTKLVNFTITLKKRGAIRRLI